MTQAIGAAGNAVRATRRALFVLVLAAGALVLSATLASAATSATAEEQFAEKINVARAAAGKSPLAVDVELTGVARSWSGVMASKATMFHNPDLAQQVTSDWTRLGENVGRSIKTGATTSELVARLHDAFMNSPAHRENILGDYNQVGAGVVVTAAGEMWVTVNFALAPVSEARPVDEGVRVSRTVFADAGASGRNAAYAVVGRAEAFADALGGSALAGENAPMLFTPGPSARVPNPVLHPRTRAEIDRVLGGRGTVYLLGGTSAVSEVVANELAADGYEVRRLAGASRVETSVAVAREVLARRGRTGEVLIARADEWADAVTGGAYAAFSGSPVVLTGRDGLHPAAAAFLAEARPTKRWALGGNVALPDAVVTGAGATRIAGADRSATAVAIAQQLWGRTVGQAGDRFVTSPGWTSDGWGYALAFAPWSASNHGPALLVGDTVPPAVVAYLTGLGYSASATATGDVTGASAVSAPVLEELRALVQ